jgi:hypothetical protein
MKKLAISILVLAIVIGATYGGAAFAGKPVQDSGTTPITVTGLNTTPYTVPSGKILYITNLRTNAHDQNLQVDGLTVAYGLFNTVSQTYPSSSLHQPIVVGEGQIVSANDNHQTINGYLQNN